MPNMHSRPDDEVQGHKEEPFADMEALPVWGERAQVTFHPELPTEVRRVEEPGIGREAVNETLQTREPYNWAAWTDGSLGDGGRRKGGAGGILVRKDGLGTVDVIKEAAGAVAPSYTTEIRAMRAALRKMMGHLPRGRLRVLLATDTQSAVRELLAGQERQTGRVEQDT